MNRFFLEASPSSFFPFSRRLLFEYEAVCRFSAFDCMHMSVDRTARGIGRNSRLEVGKKQEASEVVD